jgi:hypothetical protein
MPRERYAIICEPHEKRLAEISREMSDIKFVLSGWEQSLTSPDAVYEETNRFTQSWPKRSLGEKREFLEFHLEKAEVSHTREVTFTLHYIPGSEKAAKWQRTLEDPVPPSNTVSKSWTEKGGLLF